MNQSNFKSEQPAPFRSNAVASMSYQKKSGTNERIQKSSSLDLNNLVASFLQKIKSDQYMKLLNHFSAAKSEISEVNGVTTEKTRVNVEEGVLLISSHTRYGNKDYQVSMFALDDLVESSTWFKKILNFNGVRIQSLN